MDEGLAVRAAVKGIDPALYELMEKFGITEQDAERLKEFSIKAIEETLTNGLTIDTIVKPAKDRTVYSNDTLRTYATLANQLGTKQLASLESHELSRVRELLKAGFDADEAVTLCQHGGLFGVEDAVAARKHGISVSDLVEAWDVRYDSSYVKARKAGATHAELLEVLGLTKSFSTDFGLSDYIAVTNKDIATHEQIVAMLHTHGTGARRDYLEFVLGTDQFPGTVTHDQAMQILATKYRSPSNYWRAKTVGSHSEVIEIATAGMSSGDYITLLWNNPRVTHGEIVQLAALGGSASELPTFIRLIDAGYPYADIMEAGMSVSNYHFLRMNNEGPHLTQQQVLELKHLPLSVSDYRDLRRQGISHDTIVANASNAQ